MPPQRLHPAGEGLPFSHIPYPYLLHEDYPNLQKGVQLTDPPVSCFFPQWSPDGKQLAFGSPGGGKYAVYRVSRDGGAVEQLLDDATTPNWSPDGKQLEVATHIPDKQLGSRDSHRVKILDLKSGVTNDTPGSTGIAEACARYHDKHVRNLKVRRLQCDEIWNFVGAKARNVSAEKKAEGWGDTWTWTALDAQTKLCVSYLVGGRDAGWAKEFMEDCASRISSRTQITTDGHRAYLEAVEGAFGMDVDYAQLQKIYGAPVEDHRRYSPAVCIGCDIKVASGNPDPKHISTSYVERQNLSMRMSIRRFTRLTNAFSKKIENHAAAVAIWFMYYNFCRVHQTLRVTPAMEAGISNHVWSIQEMCDLLPETSSTRKVERKMVLKALAE